MNIWVKNYGKSGVIYHRATKAICKAIAMLQQYTFIQSDLWLGVVRFVDTSQFFVEGWIIVTFNSDINETFVTSND